jgi:hypothetical protein
MNLVELQRSLNTLRLGGMAVCLETRLLQAQTEKMSYLDFTSALITDELTRRSDRFIARRMKQAEFRDTDKRLDSFDFDFNRKMNRKLVFEAGDRSIRRPPRRRALPRAPGHRKEPPGSGDRPRRHPGPGAPHSLPGGPSIAR